MTVVGCHSLVIMVGRNGVVNYSTPASDLRPQNFFEQEDGYSAPSNAKVWR